MKIVVVALEGETEEMLEFFQRLAEPNGSILSDLPPSECDPVRHLSAGRLSERERVILLYLQDGESTQQIAKTLDIATSTVKTHVANLLRKLGVTTRDQILPSPKSKDC